MDSLIDLATLRQQEQQWRQRRREEIIQSIKNGVATLDGVVSDQLQKLAKRLGAVGFDMDEWWAKTPPRWTCSGCGRSKLQIARLNKKGELMCRLVAHHDHMGDLLKDLFAEISASLPKVLADEKADQFAKRSGSVISVHEPAVVCNDCNNADAEAKRELKLPRYFSFSPAEIRQFCTAAPNEPHQIDFARARSLWEAAKPVYDLRVELARQIATIAAKNQHWYQPGAPESNPDFIHAHYRRISSEAGIYELARELCGEKAPPPMRGQSAWRTTPRPKSRNPPTAGQIEHLAKVTHSSEWSSLPHDWKCPACGRNKIQIVRPTNKSKLGFNARSVSYLDPDGGTASKKATLCGDCEQTAVDLGREAVQSAGTDHTEYTVLVLVGEVARIVVPRPHSRHNYKNEEAEAVVDEIRQRILALSVEDIDDYF